MKVTKEQRLRILERVKEKARKDLNNPVLFKVAKMTLKKLG